MIFKPKAPRPFSPEAQTRLARIKAGGTAADRDKHLGPTATTDKKGGQRAGNREELKGRQLGKEK